MNFLFHRTYRGPLKAAILDWAGTTIDYGCCAPAIVFVDVFTRHRVTISIAEAREPMGANKRDHIAQIVRMPRVAEAWRKTHEAICSDADIDRMYADFIPLQLKCIAEYADLIPGTVDTIAELRRRGLKIGSTTGYNREMTDVIVPLARKQGYEPDSTITASDVPNGRPAPWMALKSAMEMNVYPLEAIVKIGDTAPDIAEGLNAGMWTIGVTKTGNEVGLSLKELAVISESELAPRLHKARERLASAGAHFIVDGIQDIPPILDLINQKLHAGEKP